MGKALPHPLWRLDSRPRNRSKQDSGQGKLPSEVIRKNIMITTTGVCSHSALLCALSALGEDSVLFSVDYLYEDCDGAAKFVEAAPIGKTARAKICHGNAERILRL